MNPGDLTNDAKVILLLCGHFGKTSQAHGGAAPLRTAEYAALSGFLLSKKLRPESLLDPTIVEQLDSGMLPVSVERIRGLLARGAAMSFAIEEWMNKGLWVICRSDENYPKRLKRQLREMAPPFLYGVGDSALLDRGGLAIVGSRAIGSEEEEFTTQVASKCGAEGLQVVSGGAKGVDQVAMKAGLDSDGSVIGVVADSLLRKSLDKFCRDAVHEERMVLISTVHPEAGFSVGNAMGRNKFIYALSDYALVVKAEHKKGGTWNGAVEELKRSGGTPLFVNPKFSSGDALKALYSLGALPFPDSLDGQSLESSLAAAIKKNPKIQGDLFS